MLKISVFRDLAVVSTNRKKRCENTVKRGEEKQTTAPVPCLKRRLHPLHSFSSNVTSFKILKWGSVKAAEDLFWSSSTSFSRLVFIQSVSVILI